MEVAAHSPGPDESLESILAAVKTGDTDAFARLYDRLVPLVFTIVGHTVDDTRRAQQVTQAAFVHMWRDAPCFDPSRRSITGWACAIAHAHATQTPFPSGP